MPRLRGKQTAPATCEFQVPKTLPEGVDPKQRRYVDKCRQPAPRRLIVEKVDINNHQKRKVLIDEYLCPLHYGMRSAFLAQERVRV